MQIHLKAIAGGTVMLVVLLLRKIYPDLTVDPDYQQLQEALRVLFEAIATGLAVWLVPNVAGK